MLRKRYLLQILGLPSPSALSQRERGLNPFSLWEKARMRENDSLFCSLRNISYSNTAKADLSPSYTQDTPAQNAPSGILLPF